MLPNLAGPYALHVYMPCIFDMDAFIGRRGVSMNMIGFGSLNTTNGNPSLPERGEK